MVQYLNGGLKTELKNACHGPKCLVFKWSAKSCDFTTWKLDTHTVWYSDGYCIFGDCWCKEAHTCCSLSFFEFGNLEMMAMPFCGADRAGSWAEILSSISGVAHRLGWIIGCVSWSLGCGDSSPWSRLKTLARGGPGGSSMTVTTLTLSALRLHMFQRWIERSTNFLEGLILKKKLTEI